jgi:hypothetical protein
MLCVYNQTTILDKLSSRATESQREREREREEEEEREEDRVVYRMFSTG